MEAGLRVVVCDNCFKNLLVQAGRVFQSVAMPPIGLLGESLCGGSFEPLPKTTSSRVISAFDLSLHDSPSLSAHTRQSNNPSPSGVYRHGVDRAHMAF
jgi:hypothetical protein